MNTNLEYYLNRQKTSCTVPENKNICLSKDKYLSEFFTDEERKEARLNLGITEKLDELKKIIDQKVYQSGGLPFDTEPIEGNTNNILSSDALYREFQKYPLKTDLENWKGEVWSWIQQHVNNLISEDYEQYKRQFQNIENTYIEDYNELLERVNGLKSQLDNLIAITNNGNGTLISKEFGDNDNITISQKTLTNTIKNLKERISTFMGEPKDNIIITITPDYCITEGDYEATVSVNCINNIFEKIEIYKIVHNQEEELIQLENVSEYTQNITLTDTTTIRVVAWLVGEKVTEEKTIRKYYPFFVGCGKRLTDIMKEENNYNPLSNESLEGNYSIEVKEDGEKIFILIPKSLEDQINSVTMGLIHEGVEDYQDFLGFNIPFDRVEIPEEEEYIVYVSKNEYLKGNYMIHIRKNEIINGGE